MAAAIVFSNKVLLQQMPSACHSRDRLVC